MTKRYAPLLPLFLAVTLGFFFFSERLLFPDPAIKFLGESKRVELTPGKPVTQVFTIRESRLAGFQLFMGDTDLGLGESIEFSLLDPTCSVLVKKMVRTAFTFPVTRELRFTFDPIEDSLGKSYCLSVRFDEGRQKQSERPFIRATEDSAFESYSYTDTSKNKTYIGRSLQVRPLYSEPSYGNRFQQLENRLSQYKPVLFKGYVLAIGVLIIFLGMIFFWLISRKTEN